MSNNRLIIIEGPQGTGKTTLTNFLRDNISSANLYRLAGNKDKTVVGKYYSNKMYNSLLNYLYEMQDIPMDIIFDRTFFTEEVYARLGYKDYSFTDVYNRLVEGLYDLKGYDKYYVLLYLKNVELFKKRLARESHHNYQSFSLDNSVNQQNIYFDLYNDLDGEKINKEMLAMDDFDKAYQKVKNKFKIK